MGVHSMPTLKIDLNVPVYRQVYQINATVGLYLYTMPTLEIEAIGPVYYQVCRINAAVGVYTT